MTNKDNLYKDIYIKSSFDFQSPSCRKAELLIEEAVSLVTSKLRSSNIEEGHSTEIVNLIRVGKQSILDAFHSVDEVVSEKNSYEDHYTDGDEDGWSDGGG